VCDTTLKSFGVKKTSNFLLSSEDFINVCSHFPFSSLLPSESKCSPKNAAYSKSRLHFRNARFYRDERASYRVDRTRAKYNEMTLSSFIRAFLGVPLRPESDTLRHRYRPHPTPPASVSLASFVRARESFFLKVARGQQEERMTMFLPPEVDCFATT